MEIIRSDRKRLSKQIAVDINSQSVNSKCGKIQDISQSGAFLWDCYTPDDESTVIFHIDGKKSISKECTIARKSNEKKWIAIHFKEDLTNFELTRLTERNDQGYLPGDDKTFNLARIDRTEVFREANQIKTCASNYFIWTIGLILPLTLGIWALALEGSINASSISSAMIGIIIIFTVAVFSNLEKTRALNIREGFISALDYYLEENQGPLNYRGWVNLKHCLSECGTRRRAKLCPIHVDAKGSNACRDLGQNKARIMLDSKRFFPSMLDSFISLTSFFYSIIFIGLTILTVISFSNTWYEYYQIPKIITRLWFVGGFLVGFIVWRNKFLILGLFFGVTISFIAGVIFTPHSLINFVSGALGVIMGSIAWYCLRQIMALRVRHYAYETLVHTWLEIFENCIFHPDDASKGALPTNIKDKIFNKIFSYI